MATASLRLSTLMVLILDAAVMLAFWHLMPTDSFDGFAVTLFFEFFIATALITFTFMVVLGFRKKR